MASSAATRCFEENIRIFADANTEPEKFNLYNGLFSIAQSIERIEQQVNYLLAEVEQMKRRG